MTHRAAIAAKNDTPAVASKTQKTQNKRTIQSYYLDPRRFLANVLKEQKPSLWLGVVNIDFIRFF